MTNLEEFDTSDDGGEFDWFEWNRGLQKRVPIVLLLDNSSSMDHPKLPDPHPIVQLNDALKRWTEVLHRDKALRYKAEIALITFGKNGVAIHGDPNSPFSPVAVFDAPILEAGGVTLMMEAIRTAFAILERRKMQIRAAGGLKDRALVFLLTDGYPTDDRGELDESWRSMALELERARQAKKLLFTAFGTGGANFEVLEGLAPGCALEIGTEDFYEFLVILSSSAAHADPVESLRSAISEMAAAQSQK